MLPRDPENTVTPDRSNLQALGAALLSPLFLGFAPIFGKLAYAGGSDPFTVAATRTVIAAAILWTVYLLFFRRFIYIYPAGLMGCIIIGTVNGVGSLFYYNGLSHIDASLAQLLNSTYLIFVVILSRLGGHRLNKRTWLRVMLAIIAIGFLTGMHTGQINWLGIGLMIANALLFAGTFVLSQRVLYEMPSPTVTLYVLTTMAVVVVMARLVYRLEWIPQSAEAFGAIAALGITTALSRLTMFMGIKKLGSLQTVFLGILETAVALIMAVLFLHEQLSATQWIGVGILMISLLLIRPDDLVGTYIVDVPIFNIASMSFQKIAFMQAFGKDERLKLTPEELEQIRRMMEVQPPPTSQAGGGSGRQ
ncbi:MAG: DMT family transporter [Anaerolineae bacterium]|nr:DMT family transporter [Anaerolineae bacterium]